MAKKIEVDLTLLEELASKGYTAAMCFEAVGISQSKGYRDPLIMQAIKRGKAAACQKVVDDLMSRSEADPSSAAAIFLAKKLKIYDDPFPTSSPKDAQDALKKISDIYVAVARKQLSEERAGYLISFLEKYLKGCEIVELEARISALERERK